MSNKIQMLSVTAVSICQCPDPTTILNILNYCPFKGFISIRLIFKQPEFISGISYEFIIESYVEVENVPKQKQMKTKEKLSVWNIEINEFIRNYVNFLNAQSVCESVNWKVSKFQKKNTHKETGNSAFDRHWWIKDRSTQICRKNAGSFVQRLVSCILIQMLLHVSILYRICPLFLHKYGTFAESRSCEWDSDSLDF